MQYIHKKTKSFFEIKNDERNHIKWLFKNDNFRNNQNYIFPKWLKVKLVWSLWHTIKEWARERVIWSNKNIGFVRINDLKFFKSTKWQFALVFTMFFLWMLYLFITDPDIWILFSLCFVCLWWYLIFGLKYFLVWSYNVALDKNVVIYMVKEKEVKRIKSKLFKKLKNR